jgi:hypothetical protein
VIDHGAKVLGLQPFGPVGATRVDVAVDGFEQDRE